MTDPATIANVPELLAHALAIETEACERYRELALQLETHHNPDVAALFARMAHIEGLHVEQIRARIGATELPHISPWNYKWGEEESPEAIGITDAHYMMTPHHALSLALAAEQRAVKFFARVVETTADAETKELARELLAEEEEHVVLMENWLARQDEPEADWDEDLDPPRMPE